MIDMKKNDEKGFTLVEILIAIVVLAIGVLAMGQMQIASIRGNSIANTLTEATTLAQDRMENLIGLSYNDLTAGSHPGPNNPIGGVYSIFWNIALDYPINNTKEISVIVNWTDKGLTKTVSITSMKADII
ncbi:unnamed protein product [marine sediment metagenome]|uniref:Type IV pilus modification protein PilV n=1 Tax=marine sediment metagenome TaxID=412755 RepID=X0UZ54_9ZZZZ